MDPVELLQVEHGIDVLLRMVVSRTPDAADAMVEIANLGLAIVRKAGEHQISDSFDRIVGLDVDHVKERHAALKEAWETVER